MKAAVERAPKNTVTLTVELTPEEMRPHLDRAAQALSKDHTPKGFRPGKAGYDAMRRLVGEDVLLHEAVESAVAGTLPKVVVEHKLETVGPPKIEVQKLAVGNPFVYKATVALMPHVTLGNYKTLRVPKRTITVADEDVAKAVDELRQTRNTERLVERAAQLGDKVEIDFNGYLDKVPLEGASSKTHPVVIGSKIFVPGFEEQLIGMQKGEEKTFTVRFPKEYYKSDIANRDVTFKVVMHSVYALDLPPADDAFARSVGPFKSMADLEKHLRNNLKAEREHKERDRFHLAMLEKIQEISTIGEVADVVLERETDKMLAELKAHVEQEGMEYQKYLESIRKSEADLRKELLPQAQRRIMTALLTRAIAEAEKIAVSDAEVQKEIAETEEVYAGNDAVLKNARTPEYASYLKNILTSRRVYSFLEDLIAVETK